MTKISATKYFMYYRKLKLDFDPFEGLPSHYYDTSENVSDLATWNKYIDPIDFNKQTRNWFSKNNLILKSSMIFLYVANSVGGTHVDGFDAATKQCTAINFSRGGSGLMQWFEPFGEVPIEPKLTRIAKSPYFIYDETNSTLADSYDMTEPALVRVDVPHRGINLSNEVRYSLTLRWIPKLTWEEAQVKFQSFLL